MNELLEPIKLFTLEEALPCYGHGRSSHYSRIKKGETVPPVAIGPRGRRYPTDEIRILQKAIIAGVSKQELRALVAKLVAARKFKYEGATWDVA